MAWSDIAWLIIIFAGSYFFGYKFIIGFVLGVFYLVYLYLNNSVVRNLVNKTIDPEKLIVSMNPLAKRSKR